VGVRRLAVMDASVAGLTAAETLRRRGYRDKISLIGDEPYPPYDKVPLSEQTLNGQWSASQFTLCASERIEAVGIDLRFRGARRTSMWIPERSARLTAQRCHWTG